MIYVRARRGDTWHYLCFNSHGERFMASKVKLAWDFPTSEQAQAFIDENNSAQDMQGYHLELFILTEKIDY